MTRAITGPTAASKADAAASKADAAASKAGAAASKAGAAAFWADAAPGWVRHAARHDAWAAPLGAVDRLAVRPGERVLDVGCGCGGTTAQLGNALGIDLSAAMIEAARARFPGTEFAVADVEAVDVIAGGPFAAAYSRMTVMLLSDPVAGLTAVRRSLRPGGRLAATVFRDGPANPWLAAALLGAAPYVGALPPLPMGDEPGPFAFADPVKVRRVFVAAGFTDVAVTPVDVVLEPDGDPDTVAEWLIEVGPAGAAYRRTDDAGRAAARAAVIRLIDRFRAPAGGYRLPSGINVITALRAD